MCDVRFFRVRFCDLRFAIADSRMSYVWHPSSKQWVLIWLAAMLLVLGWPPDTGRSLGVTLVRWAADPADRLPDPPAPLPMGLDDDGDAVTAHDMQEAAWNQARAWSTLNRWRMDLEEADDPFPASTQRQLLVGVVVVAALIVWQMNGPRKL